MINAGEFQRIYDPSIGENEAWYINDHCFIQAEDGRWHMFGITHQEPADPLNETFLAHATSDSFPGGPWRKQAHVLHADKETRGETHVWAPHIIRHHGLYWMYYCAGGTDHTRSAIRLATSSDLWTWHRHDGAPMVVDGYDARDPMVVRYGDHWIMYYTANSTPSGGHFVVAAVTSLDLLHWSNRREVFRHPEKGTFGGPTESPFVVFRKGLAYLFVCTNSPYSNTAVYESRDPFLWSLADQVGSIAAHAAEVVTLENGECFISRAGWGEGGLHVAKIHWASKAPRF